MMADQVGGSITNPRTNPGIQSEPTPNTDCCPPEGTGFVERDQDGKLALFPLTTTEQHRDDPPFRIIRNELLNGFKEADDLAIPMRVGNEMVWENLFKMIPTGSREIRTLLTQVEYAQEV